MKFEGNISINAPRDKVWEFLTDPYALGRCVPGIEWMKIVTPDKKFQAAASVRLGAAKASFTTDVEWLELDVSGNKNVGKFAAHGTAPGSTMDATSEMILTDGDDGATNMKWTADVIVRGRISSVASRLMRGVSEQLVGKFFECVKAKLEAESKPEPKPEPKPKP